MSTVETTARYARHVGRLGALAVALGVGVAVGSAPPIAWADPSGSTGTSVDSSDTGPADADSSATSGAGPTSPPEPEKPADGRSAPDDDLTVDDSSVPDAAPEVGLGDADTPGSVEVTADVAPEPVRSRSHSTPGETTAPRNLGRSRTARTHVSAADNSDVPRHSAVTDPAPAVGLQRALAPLSPKPDTGRAQTPREATQRVAANMVAQTSSTSAGALPAPTSAAAQDAPNVTHAVVTSLLATVLGPLAGSGPAAPAGPSAALWALAAVVRREFERWQRVLVNQTPVATAQTVDVALAGATDVSNPIALDVDDPDGDTLGYHVVEAPQHGTVTITDDGEFVYDPTDGYLGTDSFTYVATDRQPSSIHLHGLRSLFQGGAAHRDTATVTLRVTGAPVAADDSYTTAEDVTLSRPAATGVLANDTDLDTDRGELTATLASGPANGTLTLNPDGSFSYTPNADFAGTDTFTYRVSDGETTSGTGTVSVSVTPVADTPTVTVAPAGGDEDTPIDLTITASTTDSDGSETLSVTIDGVPDGAVLSAGTAAGGGRWNLTPAQLAGLMIVPPENRDTGFDLTVTAISTDGTSTAGSAPATVFVDITPVNDPPAVDHVTSTLGTGNTWVVSVSASDVEGDVPSVAVTGADESIPVTVTSTPGGFQVVADPDWARAHPGAQVPVTVTLTDGQGGRSLTTVDVGTANNAVAVGYNGLGQGNIPALPAGVTYTQVSAGGLHTVLLRSDGTAVAVGANSSGEIEIPAPADGARYTQVAAGNGYTVLLRDDGSVLGVGSNAYGQLDIPPGARYTQVAVGNYHTVLLRDDGTVIAVGQNPYGQLDIPELPDGTRYTQVAASTSETVLLRDDGIAVVAGPANSAQTDIPDLQNGTRYTQVAAATAHTALLLDDGTAIAIGANTFGQLDIPPGTNYTQVATGNGHTVLLRSDGTAVAVGSNGTGQLDIPDLPTGVRYTQVTAGLGHTVLLIAADPAPTM